MLKLIRGIRHMGSQGVTAIELAIVVLLVAIVAGGAFPVLKTSVENARFNAVVRRIVGDVRLARAKAVGSGWQYRIRGRDRRGGASASRYRLEGRRNTAIAWPAEADLPQQTTDLFVGPWVNVRTNYPGIQLDNSATGTNPPFYAGFDPSGKLCSPLSQCFNGVSPLQVTKDSTGQIRQISVAPATGMVRLQ